MGIDIAREPAAQAAEVETVLATLRGLAGEQPDLSAACAFYQRLLPVLMRAGGAVTRLGMGPDLAAGKIERGDFILAGFHLPLPPGRTLPLFLKIVEAVSGCPWHPDGNGTEGEGHLPDLVDGALRGDPDCRSRLAMLFGLDETAVQAICQNCLKPYLFAWQASLASGVDYSGWGQGICPFCGAAPILSELRGPQRARRLRCGLCGADWPYGRLRCAACGTLSARDLGLLQPDGPVGRTSVQTCSACQTYLKMMVTTAPIPFHLLIVEDLSTLWLDVAAARRGFQRAG